MQAVVPLLMGWLRPCQQPPVAMGHAAGNCMIDELSPPWGGGGGGGGGPTSPCTYLGSAMNNVMDLQRSLDDARETIIYCSSCRLDADDVAVAMNLLDCSDHTKWPMLGVPCPNMKPVQEVLGQRIDVRMLSGSQFSG